MCWQVLPAELHRQKFPMLCKLCKSRRQPGGKVFDAVHGTPVKAHWFLMQHLQCATHLKQLAAREAEGVRAKMDECGPPCQGMDLSQDWCPLKPIAHHFKTHLAFQSGASEFKKHSFVYMEATDSYIIRHTACLKVQPALSGGGRCVRSAALWYFSAAAL